MDLPWPSVLIWRQELKCWRILKVMRRQWVKCYYGRWKPSTVGEMFLRPVETFYGWRKPSTAGGNLLRLAETFFSGETILRPGDSREDQRRDTLGHD